MKIFTAFILIALLSCSVVAAVTSSPHIVVILVDDMDNDTLLGSGGFSKPKLIEPSPGGPEGQLYNLADDLGETINLYLQKPDIVARLMAEMNKIVGDGRSRARATGADKKAKNAAKNESKRSRRFSRSLSYQDAAITINLHKVF